MRFIRSVRFALQGIKYCFTSESNFRTEMFIAAVTFSAAMLLKIKSEEWLIILFCCALVLSLEIVNTAFERLSNLVNESIHPVIKLVKDLAAGAVLLASVISVIMVIIIFFPYVEMFFKSVVK